MERHFKWKKYESGMRWRGTLNGRKTKVGWDGEAIKWKRYESGMRWRGY